MKTCPEMFWDMKTNSDSKWFKHFLSAPSMRTELRRHFPFKHCCAGVMCNQEFIWCHVRIWEYTRLYTWDYNVVPTRSITFTPTWIFLMSCHFLPKKSHLIQAAAHPWMEDETSEPAWFRPKLQLDDDAKSMLMTFWLENHNAQFKAFIEIQKSGWVAKHGKTFHKGWSSARHLCWCNPQRCPASFLNLRYLPFQSTRACFRPLCAGVTIWAVQSWRFSIVPKESLLEWL